MDFRNAESTSADPPPSDEKVSLTLRQKKCLCYCLQNFKHSLFDDYDYNNNSDYYYYTF